MTNEEVEMRLAALDSSNEVRDALLHSISTCGGECTCIDDRLERLIVMCGNMVRQGNAPHVASFGHEVLFFGMMLNQLLRVVQTQYIELREYESPEVATGYLFALEATINGLITRTVMGDDSDGDDSHN